MGTRGGETQDTERHSLTLLITETGQDRTGQETSRAVPVLGSMAGQGTRAAMAERGARAPMAGQGTREAMADRGAWVAMVDPGTQEAMAERGARALESWTGPAGALESWTEQALEDAGEEPALEGAREAQTLGGTGRYLLSNTILWCLGDP